MSTPRLFVRREERRGRLEARLGRRAPGPPWLSPLPRRRRRLQAEPQVLFYLSGHSALPVTLSVTSAGSWQNTRNTSQVLGVQRAVNVVKAENSPLNTSPCCNYVRSPPLT
ncbi:unnamed protein product [Merluccius merluccius]